MKQFVKSADYIRYNANNRGSNVGDCVKRALSLAFDMSYNDMAKLLNTRAKEFNREFNNMLVYKSVVDNLCEQFEPETNHKWTIIPEKDQVTVDEFVDTYCTHGTWLIETGHSPSSRTTHILCVVDGKIYDSWDSSDEYVKECLQVPIPTRKQFTDIQQAIKGEFRREVVELIDQEVRKAIARYNKKGAEWAETVYDIVTDTYPSGYQLQSVVRLRLGERSYRDKASSYSFKVVVVLHPNDTYEEAEQIIAKTIKQRIYDRMWEVNRKENDTKETYEAEQAQGGQVQITMYGERSHQFYKSMPAWARAACNYISVDKPGRYSDSYDVYLTEPGTGHDIHFYAPTADILRAELGLYNKYGQVPGKDYDMPDKFGW